MISTKRIAFPALAWALTLGACASSGNNASGALNNCPDSAFKTLGAPPTIAFGGALGHVYSPACLQVSPNTTVTFSGDFGTHPLNPGTAPESSGSGTANTPIKLTPSGSSASFTFPTAGNYPYFCGQHHSEGMFGVVRVQ